jgi:ATP adenylyltransferase
VTLERLWAGWRSDYIAGVTADESWPASADKDESVCVFCRILASDEPDEETYVVWRGQRAAVVLNAYPYTSGHVLVLPVRHVSDLEDLDADESAALWATVTDAVRALKAAYRPEGINVGANIGRGAGAGIPGHFHVHALPRWAGDTNFMTSIAETRVMPETLSATWRKLCQAWPET